MEPVEAVIRHIAGGGRTPTHYAYGRPSAGDRAGGVGLCQVRPSGVPLRDPLMDPNRTRDQLVESALTFRR